MPRMRKTNKELQEEIALLNRHLINAHDEIRNLNVYHRLEEIESRIEDLARAIDDVRSSWP